MSSWRPRARSLSSNDAPDTADAIVVGSGPNGLAAAVTLARAGLSVHVFEGAAAPGGGCRTEELTLPGFRHDVCSAVHPLAGASPFFTGTDLAAHGVRLLTPKVAFAQPLDGGRAAAAHGSVDETAGGLGSDGRAYRQLLGPLVHDVPLILPAILAPLRTVPGHPAAMARFGLAGLLPATVLSRRFHGEQARALIAGAAAHTMLPLTAPLTSAFGLLFLMTAHSVGWPVVEGGSARLTDALVAEITSLGGRVETGRWVQTLDDLPQARAVLLDVSPRQFIALAGDRLPARQRRALERFRYGPGPAADGLHEPHPAVSELWITLEVGELDRLEAVAQPGQPDGGGAHQAAAVIAGAGDPARAVHLDPAAQDIGDPEPVRDPQRLDVAELAGRRIVVVGDPGVEGHPRAAGDRFRWNPGNRGDAAFISHVLIVAPPVPVGTGWWLAFPGVPTTTSAACRDPAYWC